MADKSDLEKAFIEVDGLFEDLIVGHNFNYAAKEVKRKILFAYVAGLALGKELKSSSIDSLIKESERSFDIEQKRHNNGAAR